ncbi:MAG TPA: DUF881 domain-containing protein [Clostridiales bacterium]|nr:DUF881 domain-containing protein [Clostridiales bacterium]
MSKNDSTIWLITLVCILLGFFAVRAFEGPKVGAEIGEIASLEKIEKLVNEKKELELKKQEMDEIIKQKENRLKEYEENIAELNTQYQQIQMEIQEARLVAGLLPVEGPGVEIVLNDRKRDSFLSNNPHIISYFIVHDSDMLHVVNELRSAGAEAIAINGTRIMANSRISCGGPTINVGKYQRFAPPFIIQAIGNPDRLMASFQQEDSIYHDLQAWGLEFQIRKVDRIIIPRYLGELEYIYAKTIQEDE